MKIGMFAAFVTVTAFATPALANYYTTRQPSASYTVREEPSGRVTTYYAAWQCYFEGRAFSAGATNRWGQVCERGSWR
jgi:hypothetical protein